MEPRLWLRVGIVVLGVLCIAWAVRRHAMFSLIHGTPVVDAADVQPGDRVAVTGRVELVDDGAVVRPAFADDDAVVAAWRTEEFRRHTHHGRDGVIDAVDDGQHVTETWDQVSTGYRSTPFYVRDDTGRVLVDPGANVGNGAAGAAATGTLGNSVTDGDTVVSFSSFEAHTPTSFDVTAAEAAGAGGQQDGIEFPFVPGPEAGERDHEEATIAPGDDVFVLGEVERTDPDAETGARSERAFDARSTGPFVLSDRGRTELLVHSGFGFLAAALGVALVAFATLAF